MQGFLYCLKEGLKGFQRAKLSSFLSLVSFTFAILLIGSFLLLILNLHQFINTIKSRMEIEVFIDNSIDYEQIQQLQSRIMGIEGVGIINFISKQKAAEFLEREFGQDIFTILEENPLPASFRIQLMKTHQHADSAARLCHRIQQLDGVDEVVYRKDILTLLDKYLHWLILALVFGGALVFFSALFFVYNTIRLIIFSQREIIEAMKLVGATPGFIRLPFLIEGFIQAGIGTGIALGLLQALSNMVKAQFPQFNPIPLNISMLLLVGGIGMGLIGSTVAIRRFLKY